MRPARVLAWAVIRQAPRAESVQHFIHQQNRRRNRTYVLYCAPAVCLNMVYNAKQGTLDMGRGKR